MELGQDLYGIFILALRDQETRRLRAEDEEQDKLNRARYGLHKDGKFERPVAIDVQGAKGELQACIEPVTKVRRACPGLVRIVVDRLTQAAMMEPTK